MTAGRPKTIMDTLPAWKRLSSGCRSPTFSAAAPFFTVTTHASTFTVSFHSAQAKPYCQAAIVRNLTSCLFRVPTAVPHFLPCDPAPVCRILLQSAENGLYKLHPVVVASVVSSACMLLQSSL